MALPRFYAPLVAGEVVALDAEQSRHALQSLRLRPGDEVVLFDGKGLEARARLRSQANGDGGTRKGADKRRLAEVDLIAIEQHPRPTHALTLYVAGCKGPRLAWLVEKCTELGATRLAFTEFERSVVCVSAAHAEKLGRTAIEACKQCGRSWLPSIDAGLAFADLVRDRAAAESDAAAEKLLVAHPRTYDGWSLTSWLGSNAWTNVGVVIGPEGGLTDAEVEALRDAGAVPVHLAENILRIETAAVSAAAIWAAVVWK
jgi:16S rRNA (uracil1498-N3)-methyltransferase